MAFLLRNFTEDQIPNEKFIRYFFVIASSAYLALKLMSVADTAVAVVKFHI